MARRYVGPYVSGRLFNKQQGAPIAGATITVNKTVYTDDEMQNPTTTVTTNGTGDWSFYALPGIYTLTTTAADAAPIEPVEILGAEGLGADRGSGTYATSSLGLYIPAGWGTNWRAKLAQAKAGTGLARVAVPGDSLAVGAYASDLDAKNWVGQVRVALQAAYGDGGSGYKGTAFTTTVLNNSTYTNQLPASNLLTLSGTWAVDNANADGPAAAVLTSGSAGASVTATVRGTTIEAFWLTGSSTGLGTITITVDGTQVYSASTNTGTKSIGTYSGTFAAGSHTVVVSCPDSSGTVGVHFLGVSGRNASGVVVDNYGRNGWPAQAFDNITQDSGWVGSDTVTYGGGGNRGMYGPAGKWSGGSSRPADLVIYGIGLNDCHISSPPTPDAFTRSVRRYLEDVKNGGSQTGSTDIMLLVHHRGPDPGWESASTQYYANYVGRLRTLADAYGCAFVNLWALGRNSWNYWNGLSYFGTSSGTAGAAGTDSVHLSDAGHANIANTILPYIS